MEKDMVFGHPTKNIANEVVINREPFHHSVHFFYSLTIS